MLLSLWILIFERLLKCVEETPVFASFLARLWYLESYQPQGIHPKIVAVTENRCWKDTNSKRNAAFLDRNRSFCPCYWVALRIFYLCRWSHCAKALMRISEASREGTRSRALPPWPDRTNGPHSPKSVVSIPLRRKPGASHFENSPSEGKPASGTVIAQESSEPAHGGSSS